MENRPVIGSLCQFQQESVNLGDLTGKICANNWLPFASSACTRILKLLIVSPLYLLFCAENETASPIHLELLQMSGNEFHPFYPITLRSAEQSSSLLALM